VNNGNILSIENLKYYRTKYGSNMNLITADIGMDFIHDKHNQEHDITTLLFAQVCYAISIQCKNGVFILKIFDCFTKPTVDILYLLSSCYERVIIMKPNTSRMSSSEKYIICKGFIYDNTDDIFPYLYKTFRDMTKLDIPQSITSFLNIPIYSHFIKKIEEYNVIFGHNQLDNINYTFSLIENVQSRDKLLVTTKQNIKKCIQWCLTNRVSYSSPDRVNH
jgi:hypothetical protein